MNLDIAGKNIFISGSSKGIGFGIANILLSEGCNVIINGRNKDSLEESKNILENKYKTTVPVILGDISKNNTINKLNSNSIQNLGPINGIIANTGSVKNVHDWNIPKTDWDWYFSNNFFVASNLIQKMIPNLKDTQGSIIFIGSIAGIEDLGAPIPYSVSKTALLSYTKLLSKRLAKYKIRVNMISPGNIYFEGGNWDKKKKKNPNQVDKILNEKVPLRKFGNPDDIGNIVAFLLSRKANFVTGSNIVADGGQTNNLF